jgi:hypothetical protein
MLTLVAILAGPIVVTTIVTIVVFDQGRLGPYPPNEVRPPRQAAFHFDLSSRE